MNLGAILKMLGVKIPPEQLAAIEAFIPQIPAKGQQVIDTVNHAVKNFDDRLKALEVEAQWNRAAMLLYLSLEIDSMGPQELDRMEQLKNESQRISAGSGTASA